MTIQTYKRITNLAFALGIIAVLCFDSFRNHLIPGLVLIGAGLIASATHICARYSMRLDRGEQSDGKPFGDPPVDVAKETAASGYAAREREVQQGRPEALAANQERGLSEFVALHVHRRVQRVYFTAPPLPVGPDLRAVETAVAVAKALSPEPTDYEVIWTTDGTLRIRPLSRIPEAQIFEEQRRRAVPIVTPESKFVQ
jgi:hypothetical protein